LLENLLPAVIEVLATTKELFIEALRTTATVRERLVINSGAENGRYAIRQITMGLFYHPATMDEKPAECGVVLTI
jgi:hypothetical protein